MSRRGAWLAALALLGCGAEDAGRVVARDDHYRVTLHTVSPAGPDRPGELRLRVRTAAGWKIADEAPAQLVLEAPPTLAFEPDRLAASDARPLAGGGFEFVTALRAERPGGALARGELAFGVCEEEVLMCIPVRHDLDLPIEVAFDSP